MWGRVAILAGISAMAAACVSADAYAQQYQLSANARSVVAVPQERAEVAQLSVGPTKRASQVAQASAAPLAAPQQNMPPASDGPSFYFGAGGSYTSTDSGISNVTGSATLDEDSYGYKIFAGYQFHPMIGVELQYADLGTATLTGNAGDTFQANGTTYSFTGNGSDVTYSAWSIGTAAVVTIPVSEMFNPFGKLGVHRWKINAEASSTTANASASETGIDLYFGGGVQVSLTKLLSLRGEYERYILDDNAVDAFTGSLLLRL